MKILLPKSAVGNKRYPPPLAKKEVYRLVRLIQDSGDTKAMSKMIRHNQGLVRSVALIYVKNLQSLSMDDLIQEGNIGLLIAIKKFDVERGFKFSTYALHWIKQTIKRAIVNLDKTMRIPIRTQQLYEWGVDTKYAEYAAAAQSSLSLDHPMVVGEKDPLRCLIADRACLCPEESLFEKQSDFDFLLKTICPRERTVLRKRFGDHEPTLDEIGEELVLTRERVRQIERKGIENIRYFLKTGEPDFPYTHVMEHPAGRDKVKDLKLNDKEKELLRILLENQHDNEPHRNKLRDVLDAKVAAIFREIYPNCHKLLRMR